MALPRGPQELTEYISIHNTTGVREAGGAVREVSTKVCDSWARITEGDATSQPVTHQHEGQDQNFEIIIPWVEGIKAWMSILWGSPARQLDIVDVGQRIIVRPQWQLLIIHATEHTERSLI